MTNQEKIIALLHKSPGMKAKEILRQLGMEKCDVCSLLYGKLKSKLTPDKEYHSGNSSNGCTRRRALSAGNARSYPS